MRLFLFTLLVSQVALAAQPQLLYIGPPPDLTVHYRDERGFLQSRTVWEGSNPCLDALMKAEREKYPNDTPWKAMGRALEETLAMAGLTSQNAHSLAMLTLLVAGDLTVANALTGQSTSGTFGQWMLAGTFGAATALADRYILPAWSKTNQISWWNWRTYIPDNLRENRITFKRGRAMRDSMERQGRDTTVGFIGGTRANFDAARNSYERDKEEAAIIIADAALFMRIDHSEIMPDNSSVRRSARSMFTRRLKEKPDAEFRKLVLKHIEEYDSRANEPESATFYKTLLDTWLE